LPEKSTPNKSKSAMKRVKQDKVKALKNKSTKNTLKTLTKKLESEVAKKSSEGAATTLKTVLSAIDKAARKGIIHRNTAARKKSALAKLVNSMLPSEAA
jgi:small subunit ribosomal protein S20